ncbi:MASE1 domain-containing protein [Streptomyces violascens]|uniref:MASE1 domain-containing protein n=1 Tax=Streptomyces violascens TaxID=67381 RepID=UPI0037A3F73C
MLRNQEFRRLAVACLRILAVAGAYAVAGRLGLLVELVIGGAKVTPLWPPTGIALACLLYLGLRIWPGIALGALLVVSTIDSLNYAVFGIIAGNTLAPVCAFLLLRRAGFRMELDRLRDGLALVFLGALAAMLVSATLGSGSLLLVGLLPASGFWSTWAAWWTGDAMGVLVITPVLLVLRALRPPSEIDPYRWAEAAALLVSTVVFTLVATRTPLDLLFLVFPLLMWAALRFQLAGAAPCVLLVSVLTVLAATRQAGPFAGRGLLAIMVTLQALNGAATLTALLLAAITTERNNTLQRIQQACKGLAEVVARLSPSEERAARPHPEDEEPWNNG